MQADLQKQMEVRPLKNSKRTKNSKAVKQARKGKGCQCDAATDMCAKGSSTKSR